MKQAKENNMEEKNAALNERIDIAKIGRRIMAMRLANGMTRAELALSLIHILPCCLLKNRMYMREEADADVRPACLRDTCFSRWNRERLKNFCSCLQEHCSRRFLLFREKAYRVSPMRFLWRWNRWNIYGHF